ncbi:MAG: hypothetical protein ACRC2K_14055 [Clostridium sp.]
MPTLSPPWFGFANEIKYTYGLSPFIKVNDLVETSPGKFDLVIEVSCYTDIAKALRQILPVSRDFGGSIVTIIIKDCAGNIVPVSNEAYTPETLAKMFCLALYNNPLFVGAVLTAGKIDPMSQGLVGDVVLVIKPSVVQFFNDDIGDLCNNFNEVASKVFTQISNLEYPVGLKVSFSTFDPDCMLQKGIFCPTNCSKTTGFASRRR